MGKAAVLVEVGVAVGVLAGVGVGDPPPVIARIRAGSSTVPAAVAAAITAALALPKHTTVWSNLTAQYVDVPPFDM